MKRLMAAARLGAACFVSLGWGLSPVAALADTPPTTWEFVGKVTTAEGSATSEFTVGEPYRILVSYIASDFTLLDDTTGGSGHKVTYAVPSLSYALYYGTSCAPCVPEKDANPNQSQIIVRDNFDSGTGAVDGITFRLLTHDGKTISLLMRGARTDIFASTAIPVNPDLRLVAFNPTDPLTVVTLEACDTFANGCATGHLLGSLDAVSIPTYGTNWNLTARDCYYIDTTTTVALDSLPNDCVYVADDGNKRLFRGRVADIEGGAGWGEFTRTLTPDSHAGSPMSTLGSVYGNVAFSGPAALPVIKGSSLPTAIARTNANVQAYQRYVYTGTTPTTLPLIVDLTYTIGDYANNATLASEEGMRPGGAGMSAILAIVDGDRVSLPAVAAAPIGGMDCGIESTLTQPDGSAWPNGSILGVGYHVSSDGVGDASPAVPIIVRSCADPTKDVPLAAGQSFVVATQMQTPARGHWTLAAGGPTKDGFVDASHTLKVVFDPNAPPALVQDLVDNVQPTCTACDFVATVQVDVRPGAMGCINAGSKGAIPVAILGSATLNVADIRTESLKLGSTKAKLRNGKPQCAIQSVNGDAYPDLVCQFDNVAANWQAGQTTATVTGKFAVSGTPFQGTDTVCVR